MNWLRSKTKTVPTIATVSVSEDTPDSPTTDAEPKSLDTKIEANNVSDNDKLETAPNDANETDDNTAPIAQATSTVSTDSNIVYPHGFRLVVIITSLCFAVFLVALDQTIIATAIPKITNQFHSLEDVGWYGSAYLLTSTSLQPTYGKIYQQFNLKWVFIGVVLLFELGSLICGVAPSSLAFIVGRAIAGLGAGGIFAGALTILSYAVPLSRRPMFAGAIGAMFGIASVAGPLLGGVFTDRITWRWCFYINLPIGGITITGILIFLNNFNRAKNTSTIVQRLKQLDFLGAFFLIPAVVCLLLVLQWGGTTYKWNDPRIIALLVVFGVLILIFATTQVLRGDKATIPMSIFLRRSIFFSTMFAFCVGSAFFTLVIYIPVYFQGVKGVSATRSGIHTLPLLISVVLASVAGGITVTIIGYFTPFMIAGASIFTIGIGLISTFSPNTSVGQWMGYQIVAGAGVGSCFQLPIISVQAVTRQHDIPIASALVIFFQQLGGALFVGIGQAVFQNKLIPQMESLNPSLNGTEIVMAGATGLKSLVPADQLSAVLDVYANSLDATFEVAIAMAGIAAIMACFIEFKSIKGKKIGPGAAAA